MKEHDHQYAISVMSRALKVSRSGYYDWLCRKPSLRAKNDERLAVEIKAAHIRTRETYGNERLCDELKDANVLISLYKTRKLRKELGIKCKQSKRFKTTTDSNHNKHTFDNLLNQNFVVSAPNVAFVSDITYIWAGEGWLYLAGVKDLYTREVVGYAMSNRMTTDLCLKALNMAITRKKPRAGLILHSDRGSQYCSKAYIAMIEENGFKCSMSGKGNCYDNAPIESFLGTLKNELVYQRHYTQRQVAIDEITEYIEVFYNRMRKHSGLGNISPAQALQAFKLKSA